MKTLITLSAVLLSMMVLASGPEKNNKSSEPAFVSYDPAKGSWEQPNPIFRWPLPTVSGEVHINLQFVVLGEAEGQERILSETMDYLNSVYGSHGIFLNFKSTRKEPAISQSELLTNWKTILPEDESQLTVYVLPFQGTELERVNIYSTNGVVSGQALVPLQEEVEFKVFVAKNVGHMLGLLPTYFESPAYGVNSEDPDNCGNAGDFVCDTPPDYLGLRNDVKKRSCRYTGKIGEPDAGNIMSNSWTECMDHITPEQANKIKYNLSVIPALQSVLNEQSTIPFNIDELSFEQEDNASLD